MAKTACQSDAGFRRYKLLKSVMVLSCRVLSCLVGSGRVGPLMSEKIPYLVRTRSRFALTRNKERLSRLCSKLVCR